MRLGRVTHKDAALLPLRVLGSAGSRLTIEFLVDMTPGGEVRIDPLS